MTNRVTLIVVPLLLLLAAACGGGSETVSELTSQSDAEPAAAQTDETSETNEPDGTDESDAADETGETGDDGYGTEPEETTGIPIDANWVELVEPRFVSQAPLGSLVNLHAEPSPDAELVGTVMAGEVGITLYDEAVEVDGRPWSPVRTADGTVGWMKASLLRPEPSVSPPERIGDSALRGSDALRLAIAGLSAPNVLADQIDERGLTVSATAFIDEDAVVLSAEQLRQTPADDTTVLTWGLEVGVGDPIEATMTERFRTLAGSTAVTSTEATGFNVLVGVGNIPSNIADVYPGAEWVELHHSGTKAFEGLDWESLTFVFDTTGEAPVLIAITTSAWAP